MDELEDFVQLMEILEVWMFENGNVLFEKWEGFMELCFYVFKCLEEVCNVKLIGWLFEVSVDLYLMVF